MVDWASHYDGLYGAIAVGATFVSGSSGAAVAVTAIDKTAGVAIADDVMVQSVKPAATVRMSELIANGIARTDLDGSSIALNGRTWRIKTHVLRPSPAGEDVGEVYLFLTEIP